MVEFEELRLRLLDSEKPIENLKEALAIDSLKAEVEVLEKESAAPDFWDDMENSQKVMQKIGSLKAKVTGYESLRSDYEDALVMIELADEEGDLSLLDDCTASVKDIETRVEDMTLSTLLSGEFDGKNALLTFHAGAGGTEAQDWAEMLFRMYNRWGERHGYKVSTLDYLDGDVAGIKSATILVEGENAYGYLKGEMGIHRLVRVSPFDSSGRRHTSFASVEVMPEIDDDVNVEIREEVYIYSRIIPGPGGMPIGTNGSAMLLLSGGIDSPVAGYMVSKRGVELEATYFHAPPYTSERAKEKVVDLARLVSAYSGPIKLHVVNFTDIQLYIYEKCPHDELTIIMRRYMMKIAEHFAKKDGCLGLITGESIGQVASQTMQSLAATNAVCTLPVYRPLIGFDKKDIVEISEKINTYETSIQPFEDCCTIFVAKHPVTKPNIERIEKSELNLAEKIDELMQTAIDTVEIIEVKQGE